MQSISTMDGPYVLLDGKKLLDFSSCDFLGLAQHPEVKKGAIKYALKYGVGGHLYSTPQIEIEYKLAQYLGKETALLFSSEAEMQAQLSTLKKVKSSVITYDFGITGTNGFGSWGSTEIVYGLLHFGSAAFIAGPKKLLSSLMPGKLSFPNLGAIDCALSFIPEMDDERKIVQKNKAWLLKQLKDFKVEEEQSPRIVISTEQESALRDFFMQEQIYLAPQALYFAVTALHTPDDLDQLAVSLKKLSATDLAVAMQLSTPTPKR